jgi:hypothetical protein
VTAPGLPDRATFGQVHAAMSPGLPDHDAAMDAPSGPLNLPEVPAAHSKHTGPPDGYAA